MARLDPHIGAVVPPRVGLVCAKPLENDHDIPFDIALWQEALAPLSPEPLSQAQAWAAWCEKQVTALIILPTGISSCQTSHPQLCVTVQTWQRHSTLSLPCAALGILHLLQEDSHKTHLQFCGHGLCQHTLMDPLGQRFDLRTKEAELLAFLFCTPQTTRAQVLQEVWGYDAQTQTETVEVHLSTLRQVLQGTSHPLCLTTGAGEIILQPTVAWRLNDSSQTLSVPYWEKQLDV